MKIDLHCHTLKTKSEESEKRNVSIQQFREKIELAEIKMLAITNHNLFNEDNYNVLRENVKDICHVLPGVELDVEGEIDKSHGHIILVCSQANVSKFKNKLELILKNSTPDTFIINTHELYDNFKDLDIIYIAHFLKDKQLSINDLNDFQNYMDKPLRLLKEASNIVSIGVLQSNNHRAMIGSDIIDWDDYEKSSFGELKFEISDFDHLLKLVDKDKLIIEDLINENLDEKIVVYGKSQTKEFPFEIPIYDDVNIIFGDKGSGKSEIIYSLKNYYDKKGLKCTTFSGGDKESWYTTMKSIKSEEYDIKKLELDDNLEFEYKNIINFSDKNPNSIKNYFKYFKNCSTNSKKKKMKCLNIEKFLNFSEEKYNLLYNDIKEIDYFMKKLDNFEYTKTHKDEIENLKKSLKKTRSNIIDEYKKNWIYENSKRFVDDFVEKMNKYVSENVGSPSMPTDTGLFDYIKNRIDLKNNCSKFLETLNSNKKSERKFIGKLGLKGEVKIKTDYEFINSENKKKINAATLSTNKTELAEIITNIEKIIENISSNKIVDFIKTIKDDSSKLNINSLKNFISINRDFTINDNPYKPSKGELAILSLQHDLLTKKDYDIFLIDEPEANLGSTYINDEIVPLLNELARSKKKIVVATHDANIAIRTRPSCSILKVVNNDQYKTYIGNMFTDILQDINSTNKLSWKNESIKYLEGGKEAFEERSDLYE